MEEYASDLAELPVPVIWQNCLSVDSVPVIWQNSPYVEEGTSDLAELPFGRIVCLWTQCASDLAEMPVPMIIWQKSLHVEEHASDFAQLPVPVIWQNNSASQGPPAWTVCQ